MDRKRFTTPRQGEQFSSEYDFPSDLLQDLQGRDIEPVSVTNINLATAGSLLLTIRGRGFVPYFYLTTTATTNKAREPAGLVTVYVNQADSSNSTLAVPAKHNRGFRGSFFQVFITWAAQANTSVDFVIHKSKFTPWMTDDFDFGEGGDVVGNLHVEGTLLVNGATTLSSTLAVTGATELASSLSVSGNTTLNGTLHVVGAGTFDAAATIGTTLAVGGALVSSANLSVLSASDTRFVISTSGNTNAEEIEFLDAAASGNKNYLIAHNLHSSGLEFTPSTAVNGRTYTTPTLVLNTDGTASFVSALAVGGTLAVGGALISGASESLLSAATTTFVISTSLNTGGEQIEFLDEATSGNKNYLIGHNIHSSGLEFTPSTVINGRTYTTPTLVLNTDGTANFGGALGIAGAATLSSTLHLVGAGTFDGLLTVGTTLAVGGALQSASHETLSSASNTRLTITSSDNTKAQQIEFLDASGSGNKNYLMAHNLHTGGLEFTPSTAANGRTYSTLAVAFNTDSTVLLASLAGTGSRAVLADATGLLSAPVSDRALKKEIIPIVSQIDPIKAIQALSGVFFHWDTTKPRVKNHGSLQEIGMIAQDVEAVVPQAVREDAEGWKSLDYSHLVPILIEGFKILHAEVMDLRGRVK